MSWNENLWHSVGRMQRSANLRLRASLTTICYHRAGYRCNIRVLMILTHFMDAFITYPCADILYCFNGLKDLLLKRDCVDLLGIYRLKACIAV